MDNTSSRKLAAILFADIAGYTAAMQENEQQAMAMLNHYQQVLKDAMERHQGEVIKNYGDGSICILPTASGAVKSAMAIQEALKEDPAVTLRIGLHVGDVIHKDGDIYGDAVNIASRIESMGIPGSILVSRSLYQKVRNQPEFQFTSLGSFEFKNVEEPVEVYALSNEGFPIPNRKELQGKFKSNKKGFPTWLKILSPIIILAILGISYWSQLEKPTAISDNPLEITSSIAILPFENLSDDPDQEYLAKGLSIEISNLLGRIPQFKVIPSKYLRDNKLSPMEIGKEYEVKYILSGTTSPKNEMIDISVELVNTIAGSIQWSDDYSDSLSRLLILKDKIVRALGSELRFKLQELSMLEKQPINLDVYLNWLKFMHLTTFNPDTEENSLKQKTCLLEAYSLDSSYLPVLDGLINNLESLFYWDQITQEVYNSDYSHYLEKMKEVDPNSQFTLWRSALYESMFNDFTNANALLTELVNTPHLNILFYSGAGFQLARYNLEKGKKIVEEAIQRDPLHVWNYHNLAAIYYWEQRFDESLDMWMKYSDIVGNTQMYTYFNALITALNEETYSIELLSKLEWFSERDNFFFKALNAGNDGKENAFNSIMNDYIQTYGDDPIETYFIGKIYAHLGYTDLAFEWLEKAFDSNNLELFESKVDPFFRNLHSDPRWPVFLRKIGFPEELLD